jgi:hypothetical protein
MDNLGNYADRSMAPHIFLWHNKRADLGVLRYSLLGLLVDRMSGIEQSCFLEFIAVLHLPKIVDLS